MVESFKRPYDEAGHDIESLFKPGGDYKCARCGEYLIDLSEDLMYGTMRRCKKDNTMTEYNVKSWVAFFQAFKRGEKKHDMRDLKDRDYQVGDVLNLQEYDPFKGEYTGDEMRMKITYITSAKTPCAFSSAALDKNYCILSLEPVE